MKSSEIKCVFEKITSLIEENKDYLIELDQKFGDGDLGISMEQGFQGIVKNFPDEDDLGKLFLKISRILNENAPSSLGTILSFGLMGIAKSLKGKQDLTFEDFAFASRLGIENIKNKAGSKLNEKTIVDAIDPAVKILEDSDFKAENIVIAKQAFLAAKEGAENTKNMMAVHGRAAYHQEKTIGIVDGGAYVGRLIFEGIYEYFKCQD